MLHYRERTTILSLLSGVSTVFFPLVEFLGGQLFRAGEQRSRSGGYYAVYGASLAATFLGILYVIVIPESVVRRVNSETPIALHYKISG